MNNVVGSEHCPCGDFACKDYHLTGIGKFVQGSGFTLDEARFIIRACNTHHELVEALRWALGRLNDARAVCYGGVTADEIEARQAVLRKAE